MSTITSEALFNRVPIVIGLSLVHSIQWLSDSYSPAVSKYA